RELKEALGLPAAASFKHVSPTSAAVGIKMSETQKRAFFVDDIEGIDESPIATAYARARGTDRLSSYGDWAALSDKCDAVTARILQREVSDGVIAPAFDEEALEILKEKKKGRYTIIQMDPDYVPQRMERKQVNGIVFSQEHNDSKIGPELFENIVTEKDVMPEEAKRDLIVAMITLKYTQSNSVCYAVNGQAIGVGAGQQSRIHCTRLAGDKADRWQLRQHSKVLDLPFKSDIRRPDRDNAIDIYLSEDYEDVIGEGNWQAWFTERPEPFTREEQKEYLRTITGVSLGSDAFFPFGDNIERAAKSGVSYVAQPGGSVRDDNVIDTCNKYGMVMAFTGLRLFHH
ncbi:MAG: phosphoribosylaminoimidazolecarboxamide formyltransferase, partial [Firmicutes bacterium]|nr:phosphoribosylaminoimidazolecarboxamide formyltransferase [Bacillota bacterium]